MTAPEPGLLMKYFVLKPKGGDTYALASREAMRTYAQIIGGENPALAKELRGWANREASQAGSADWRAQTK